MNLPYKTKLVFSDNESSLSLMDFLSPHLELRVIESIHFNYCQLQYLKFQLRIENSHCHSCQDLVKGRWWRLVFASLSNFSCKTPSQSQTQMFMFIYRKSNDQSNNRSNKSNNQIHIIMFMYRQSNMVGNFLLSIGAPLYVPIYRLYMTHSQMLGKGESGWGPIFKVVLEC